LDRDTLLIHLRMSGGLRVESTQDEDGNPRPLQPHDRLVLDFQENLRLVLNDPRKFGRVWLVKDPAEVLNSLGPEPLDPAYTAEDLRNALKNRQRSIKPLLLDQTFIAGLGNIYTDEALHLAKIHPLTPAARLTEMEVEHLWLAIRSVLMEGIRRNGASIDWVYRGGDFQNHFRVYGRSGQPCPVCGTPIERIVVGQRGTHFCPVCQPYPSGKGG
jgi:formamidopyrimidine-DNA glycosylase